MDYFKYSCHPIVIFHFFNNFAKINFFDMVWRGPGGSKKISSGHFVKLVKYKLFSAKNSKFSFFWFLLVILVIFTCIERYLLRKWGVRHSNSVSWRHVLQDYDNVFQKAHDRVGRLNIVVIRLQFFIFSMISEQTWAGSRKKRIGFFCCDSRKKRIGFQSPRFAKKKNLNLNRNLRLPALLRLSILFLIFLLPCK